MGDWPIALLILTVGYTIRCLRPLRPIIRWLRLNHILRSAERLGRRDRISRKA